MSMLADDVADNDLAVLWPIKIGSVSEVGGVAHFDLTTETFASLSASRYYDLRGDGFAVAIADTGFAAGDTIWLRLDSQRPNYGVEIQRTNTQLEFYRIEA